MKTKSLASRKGKPSGNASIGVRLMRYWPLYVMLLPCIVYYALICYVPMAGSVLAMIPMIIIYIIFQRQFIEGIALTGTKA